MFYYKITATLINEEIAEKLNDRREGYEERSRLCAISDEMLEEPELKDFFYISSVSSKNVVMGYICEDNLNAERAIRTCVKKTSIELTDIDCKETTLRETHNLLRSAERGGYIECDDVVLESFGLLDLFNGPYNRVSFTEGLVSEVHNDLLDGKNCFMARKSLKDELDRICSVNKKSVVPGHPVHYLIQTDDINVCEDIVKVLLNKLYDHKRLRSRRYTAMNFESCNRNYMSDWDTLFHSNGGSSFVAYLNFDNENEDNYASGVIDIIEKVCTLLKKYSNDVLTILWLPKTAENLKKVMYEYLGHTNLVEICDEVADADDSTEYLKILAKDRKIKTDKKLFEGIDKGKTYLASELNDMFDLWYSNKLKTSVFPQYKDIASVKGKVAKEAPKGCAYDELMEMIGLERAKSIIKQALDYNKAQKIFADKGMKSERTSMHMVFMGNPGTAKTSVARLFSQIMKDNKVLSQGHIVEVGRADLVGRFVGWTAPTVKKEFQEAKGGVLFIDEAYSLVDDRDGLYGDEAINTIVQEMENHRDEVVVIFAGYPDKMEKFLQKNPGLRSRIAYHVPFDDYSIDELCGITDLIAKKKGLILADDAKEKLRGIYDIAVRDDDFGNGRYVRNILEKAKMAQASRLVTMDYESITMEDVKTIVASDIEMPPRKKDINKFGFVA